MPAVRLPPAPSRSQRRRPAGLLALAACAGCAGAPLGLGLLPPMAPASSEPCLSSLVAVEHLDEPTPLGFSAVEALARLAGPHAAPLSWAPAAPNDEYVLEYGPELGPSLLELDVRARDGQVLLVEHLARPDAPEDTVCPPSVLAIPVEVTLRSAGQALDEHFATTLEATAPYQGRIRHRFAPGSLRGGLTFSQVLSLDPARAFWPRALELEARLWEGGSMGSLGVELGASHAREASAFDSPPAPAQPLALAAWPSAQSCEGAASRLPSDAKVLGFSARDVLARLGSPAARPLTWSDGSVVPVLLELEPPAAELCQEAEEALRFGAMLRARSEDGSLDVRLPVQIEARGEAGDIAAIDVESSAPEAPHRVPAPARRPSLRFGDYRALLVALEWRRQGERESGSLALRGVDSAQPDAEGRYASSMLTSGRW